MGCGSYPSGHVNIDTLKDWNNENKVQVKHFKNFIIADGMNLPFRRIVFNLVKCIMALEHFIHPAKAIQDFVFVANRSYLVVPNNPIFRDSSAHLFSWSQESFFNFLAYFYEDIVITTGTQNVKSIDRLYVKIIMKIPLFRDFFKRFAKRFLRLRIYALCRNLG